MKFEIKILFSIAILTSICLSIVNAFFAPIVIQKNINESILGIIISVYSVFIIIVTPFTANVVDRFSRRNIFLLSLILQAVFTASYGILTYIENYYVFVITSILVRILHGIAAGFNINLLISSAALLSNKDEVNSNFAMIDLGWMFGKFCGPLITSIFYSFGGVFFTFTLSSLCLLFSFYFALKIDFKIDESDIKKPKEKKENFFSSLMKFDIFILFVCQFLNMVSKTFYGPLIFNHISTKFGFSIENASKFISLSFISYYLTILYIDKLIKTFGTKVLMVIGILINFLAVNLLTPVSLFPQSIILVAIGFFMLGFPSGCIDIPIMSDLVNTLKQKYAYPENLANDITSSVYTFANYMGESLGPMYGGYLTYVCGFEFSCIFTGIMNLCFFFFFGILYRKEIFGEKYDKTEKIHDQNTNTDTKTPENQNLLENNLNEKFI